MTNLGTHTTFLTPNFSSTFSSFLGSHSFVAPLRASISEAFFDFNSRSSAGQNIGKPISLPRPFQSGKCQTIAIFRLDCRFGPITAQTGKVAKSNSWITGFLHGFLRENGSFPNMTRPCGTTYECYGDNRTISTNRAFSTGADGPRSQ